MFAYTCIDLTHTLSMDAPSWEGSCGFHLHTCKTEGEEEVVFHVQHMRLQAGMGTHMDAPAHMCSKGATIDELTLDACLRPCVVIDVRSKAHEYYKVSAQDILNFEKMQGFIEAGTCVFVHTGWGRFWDDSQKYRNNLVFPSVSFEAIKLLMTRSIAGLGIDTLSPDLPESGYPVHRLLLEAGHYIIENVSGLDRIPVSGAYVLALPMKIKGATEAPIRLVALIPKNCEKKTQG